MTIGFLFFETISKVGLSIKLKFPPVAYLKFEPGTNAKASKSWPSRLEISLLIF